MVMPQEAKNAANHFATLVERKFGPLRDDSTTPMQKIFVYQDDVLNYTPTFLEHFSYAAKNQQQCHA
jgi:hypothetical protein